MTRSPQVLIGWSSLDAGSEDVRERVRGWISDLGYVPDVTMDAREMVAWVRERVFVASLLDCRLAEETGEPIWRGVRPIVGHRLVLMAREIANPMWFEALRAGVGALLPLPPEEGMVRAALRAAVRAPPPGPADRRS